MIETAPETLLSIKELRTCFPTRAGLVTAVDGVSLDVRAGECLGVVGESGSGKSVTFSSVIGLVRRPGYIAGGSVTFRGRELTALSPAELRAVRGREIAMTMQDALTALNPALTIEEQIVEVLLAHAVDLPRAGRKAEARRRAVDMLRLVGIASPETRIGDYPHQFSGGMRQRIMIAIALACRPMLLIADEPTTALDVTIQAQVLELIADLRRQLGMSVVLITHDLGVVAEYADRLAVMYAGQVVETGPTRAVLDSPRHPYTRGLLGSIPRLSDLDAPIRPIEGQAPELVSAGEGCRFASRCPMAVGACYARIDLVDVGPGRAARCIRALETAA
ncbi:ABC transporter ATP-binding protein [Alsobacter sp. SYSU M60028]|uniref:ABC transporter ATP-binding protein n=1 Tax=Alsobacter ponti TaxID=2962936 RepID=A0ABT1L7R0_9HYPH|nr:ABC transporter ATP-binding protein [Alsobacter ponti]MCP8937510.1 ABC transporter ATP-binding protein [Alsobacter ponti]